MVSKKIKIKKTSIVLLEIGGGSRLDFDLRSEDGKSSLDTEQNNDPNFEANNEPLSVTVYDRWPNARLNTSTWPLNHSLPNPSAWRNETSVDDIFGWGERYGRTRRPIFAKVPVPYSTLFNTTPKAGMDSAYILGISPQNNSKLCSIRAFLTPNCSTEYRTSIIGGSLTSRCKDGNDELSYSELTGKTSNVRFETGWIDLLSDWGTAIGFGGGLKDFSGSNSRLLTQFIPTEQRLNSTLPSIAEALAILVGGSLLLGSIDAPLLLSTKYDPTLYDPTLSQTRLRGLLQRFHPHARLCVWRNAKMAKHLLPCPCGRFFYQWFLPLLLLFSLPLCYRFSKDEKSRKPQDFDLSGDCCGLEDTLREKQQRILQLKR